MSAPLSVCEFFLEGKCRRGHKCRFAHTTSGKGSTAPSPVVSSQKRTASAVSSETQAEPKRAKANTLERSGVSSTSGSVKELDSLKARDEEKKEKREKKEKKEKKSKSKEENGVDKPKKKKSKDKEKTPKAKKAKKASKRESGASDDGSSSEEEFVPFVTPTTRPASNSGKRKVEEANGTNTAAVKLAQETAALLKAEAEAKMAAAKAAAAEAEARAAIAQAEAKRAEAKAAAKSEAKRAKDAPPASSTPNVPPSATTSAAEKKANGAQTDARVPAKPAQWAWPGASPAKPSTPGTAPEAVSTPAPAVNTPVPAAIAPAAVSTPTPASTPAAKVGAALAGDTSRDELLQEVEAAKAKAKTERDRRAAANKELQQAITERKKVEKELYLAKKAEETALHRLKRNSKLLVQKTQPIENPVLPVSSSFMAHMELMYLLVQRTRENSRYQETYRPVLNQVVHAAAPMYRATEGALGPVGTSSGAYPLVGMDCEMVETKTDPSAIARVTLVALSCPQLGRS
jgi:hypothetical protein